MVYAHTVAIRAAFNAAKLRLFSRFMQKLSWDLAFGGGSSTGYYAVLLDKQLQTIKSNVNKCIIEEKQHSNAFVTVKMRLLIACISSTKHDLGLKSGAIVFCDLTLPHGSLFSKKLGIDFQLDFGPVVARENLSISKNEDFHLENEVSY
ncbi:hypothetical protein MBANPS3_002117 [Mucor bainieri]